MNSNTKRASRLVACVLALGMLTGSMSSCGLLFGGPLTEYQKNKPSSGQPTRDIRLGVLIADVVLFWPSLIVDFVTGAIYRPEPGMGTGI